MGTLSQPAARTDASNFGTSAHGSSFSTTTRMQVPSPVSTSTPAATTLFPVPKTRGSRFGTFGKADSCTRCSDTRRRRQLAPFPRQGCGLPRAVKTTWSLSGIVGLTPEKPQPCLPVPAPVCHWTQLPVGQQLPDFGRAPPQAVLQRRRRPLLLLLSPARRDALPRPPRRRGLLLRPMSPPPLPGPRCRRRSRRRDRRRRLMLPKRWTEAALQWPERQGPRRPCRLRPCGAPRSRFPSHWPRRCRQC
mmetsp:Transcript_26379/g.46715  ORF Transcript_26379/g.46715 Transcript_26379/m.46715 type:complete len:247 (+) Transcript_26379:744-1484(+)